MPGARCQVSDVRNWAPCTQLKNRVASFCQGLVCLVVCLLLVACATAPIPEGMTLQVQQVLTGREFEVAGVLGQPEITERVRLEGIDVPDLAQQPWGNAAKTWLQQVIGNQSVLLESDVEPRDESGQRLVYLWQNGELVNEKLVAEGYALAVPHPPNHKYDQRLARAQDQARIMGLGIWNPQKPMRFMPTDFRKSLGRE